MAGREEGQIPDRPHRLRTGAECAAAGAARRVVVRPVGYFRGPVLRLLLGGEARRGDAGGGVIPQYKVGVDWRGENGDRSKPIITWAEHPLVIACDLCQRVTLCYLDVDDNIYHAGVGRVVRQTVLCHNKAGCAEARG